MYRLVSRLAVHALALAIVVLYPISVASAQNVGAPRPGLRLAFQPGFTFAQFTGDDSEGTQFSSRRGTSLTVRGSYLLLGAVSGYLEVGSAGRGSTVREQGVAGALDVRVNWWDVGGGLNVALRCIKAVCPSIDAGGVVARSREAILRDDATGRPVGTLPIARYETSVSAGLRLVVPRLRGLAVVIRHQEGLSNLARDRTAFRSRAQFLQLALPLTQD